MKTIVAATDFSEVSLVAIETAFRLNLESKGTLYLLHIVDLPLVHHPMGIYHPSASESQDEADNKLRSLIPDNWDQNATVETALLLAKDSPAGMIADFAAEKDADLIVVGTHGRTGLERLLMGSTAESLLHQSPCQVLVVKPKTLKKEVQQESVGATNS